MHHMSRSRVIAVAAVLIASGWGLWSLWDLWPSGQPAKPSPSIRDQIRRAEAMRASWPRARKTKPDDLFTFENEGKTVTVDLAQVRRSHRLLVRKEAALAPDGIPNRTPDPSLDFLSWPVRSLRGQETIQTLKCWVIDFSNPASDQASSRYGVVRLFVRKQDSTFFWVPAGRWDGSDANLLMRMTGYNWSGQRTFDYGPESFKIVDGTMMVSSAAARHYEPGTSRVAEEVEYRALP